MKSLGMLILLVIKLIMGILYNLDMWDVYDNDDVCWWFMLDLGLNKVIMMIIACNLDIYVRTLVFVGFNLMNI